MYKVGDQLIFSGFLRDGLLKDRPDEYNNMESGYKSPVNVLVKEVHPDRGLLNYRVEHPDIYDGTPFFVTRYELQPVINKTLEDFL